MTQIPQSINLPEEITKEELTDWDFSLNAEEIVPLIAKYRLLPRLTGELIIDRAIAPFTLTKEETDKTYQRFCQQEQITKDKELQSWLKDHHLTVKQLKNLLIRKLKIEKFKQDKWGQKIDSYFSQRKSQLDRVVYSLIQVRDENLALELYFRLREEEASFANLARRYSEGILAETGGLIGPVSLSSCPKSLAKIFSVSQAGQIYPPQSLGSSTVIIKFEQYISAHLDDRMRQRLLTEMFATWLHQEITVVQKNIFSELSTS